MDTFSNKYISTFFSIQCIKTEISSIHACKKLYSILKLWVTRNLEKKSTNLLYFPIKFQCRKHIYFCTVFPFVSTRCWLPPSFLGNKPKCGVNNMNCYLCGKSAAPIECQACHQAWFCSQEHLEELHHPPQCFPIKVETSEVVGRYLVASRDLAPLDLILSDVASPSG